MAKVDNLEIEISAQSTKASASLQILADRLDRVSASLSGVNSRGMTTMGNGVDKLSSAMANFKANTDTELFRRLASNLKTINKVDTAQFSTIASGISGMSAAISKLPDMGAAATQFESLANGMKQLGYASATKAIDNIPKLTTAMELLINKMSKLPAVSQNLINFTNALAKLSRTGGASGTAAKSLTTSLTGYSSGVKTATSHTFSFASALGKLYATYWMLFRAFRVLGEAINISSDLTEVQNVVDATFGEYSDLVEKMSDTSVTDFGMSELTVKTVASRFQAMGTAMGISQQQVADSSEFLAEKGVSAYGELGDSMADMSVNLTKLTADMASFYNLEHEDVAEDLQSIFTGQTRPLKQYGLDLTEATLKEWAMKNGLDANISSMSQAEKTMLRYQYVMAQTGAAQGDFAKTAGTWSNQVKILKANIQDLGSVVGGTFINAFKPLLKTLNIVIIKFIDLAEVISNSLGKIFGWTYETTTGGGLTEDYEGAADYADDLASGTGDAASNAKKLKDYMSGLDELNVLSPDDSSSNSGSGSTGSSGASTAVSTTGGNWVQTESILEAYESELDSLGKLGEFIGEKLTNSLNNINWDSVYQSVINFGTGLADFLNGLISPELFGAVGTTIANSLNTAIYSALSFGETFDFNEFGVSIGTGINDFFNNFDFAALGQTLNVWVDGLFDALREAIDTIEWDTLFNNIFDGISEIKPKTALILGIFSAPALLTGISSLTKNLEKLFGSISLIGDVTSRIFGSEGGLFGSSGIIAKASSPVGLLTAGFLILATGLGVVYKENDDVKKSFNDAIKTIKGGLSPVIETFTNDVLPALRSGWDKIVEVLTPLGDFLEEVFISLWQDFLNPALTWLGETLLPLVNDAFSKLWNKVLVPLGNFILSVFQPIIQGISDLFTKLWKNIIVPLADFLGATFSSVLNLIVTIFTEKIIPGAESVIKVFQFLWDNVLVPIGNYLKNVFQPIFEFVFDEISIIIESAKKVFAGLIDFVTNVFKGDWSAAWESVKQVFTGIFDGIKKTVLSVLNSVISFVETGINAIIRSLNNFLTGINAVIKGAGKIVGKDWDGINLVSEIKLKRISGYENGGFPEPASLFWAGENGVPEMLGTVGGRTAVASGAEITGIANAVYTTGQTEASLLMTAINILQQIADKDTTVNIGDREIARANNRGQKALGRQLITEV